MLHNSKILAVLLSCLCLNLANAQGITPVGGGGSGSGTVTSISTDCGVSGGPITTTGTISGNVTPNPQTGTSYAIQNSDCGKLITLSNASAVAVSIAQAGTAGQFASGWFATVKNLGVGTVTITPTTSTIDGAANLALTTNQSIDLYSDGINYVTGRGIGGSSSGANPTATASDVAVNGVASTFMRSDAAPAVQLGTSSQKGIVQVDNIGITASSGVISANSPFALAYVSNNWYIAGGEMIAAAASNSNTNNGTVSCYPFYFHGAGTINALGGFVNTVSAGGNYSVAIYANNSSTMRPTGTALGSSGSLSTTSSAAVSGVVSIAIASPRWLWACANSDNNTATLRAGSFYSMSGFMGSATQANIDNGSSKLSGVTTPVAFASGWTDLTAAVFTELQARNYPLVQFKIQ